MYCFIDLPDQGWSVTIWQTHVITVSGSKYQAHTHTIQYLSFNHLSAESMDEACKWYTQMGHIILGTR